MKSVIKYGRVIKERELEGLSGVGVCAIKRTTAKTKLFNGMPQTIRSTVYIARWLETGHENYYSTYKELKRALVCGGL